MKIYSILDRIFCNDTANPIAIFISNIFERSRIKYIFFILPKHDKKQSVWFTLLKYSNLAKIIIDLTKKN